MVPNHQPNKVITCHNNNIGSKPKPKILAPNSPNSPNGPGTCHPLPVSLSWGQVVNGVISKVNLRILEMASFWGGRVSDILPLEAGLPTSNHQKCQKCSLQHFVCDKY